MTEQGTPPQSAEFQPLIGASQFEIPSFLSSCSKNALKLFTAPPPLVTAALLDAAGAALVPVPPPVLVLVPLPVPEPVASQVGLTTGVDEPHELL